jgi:hypothetical protein
MPWLPPPSNFAGFDATRRTHARQRAAILDGDPLVGRFGEPDGRGTFKYADGSVYEGEFRGGRREGRGAMTFAQDGSTFVGEWKAGKQHGGGTFTGKVYGDVYRGEWREGHEDGAGLYSPTREPNRLGP